MVRWEVSRFDRFNTASGMRSHVTEKKPIGSLAYCAFQYRKRYEITCDGLAAGGLRLAANGFQYRKRYEITCDGMEGSFSDRGVVVSIPQAV